MDRKPTYEELERRVRDLEGELSSRVRTEEGLREKEEQLRLVLDATDDAVWDLDARTGKAYFGSRYYTMLGFQPDEFEPRYDSWVSLVHPEDIQAAERAVKKNLDGESDAFKIEFRMRTKSGDWKWILGRGKVVERDDRGGALAGDRDPFGHYRPQKGRGGFAADPVLRRYRIRRHF